MKRKIEIVFKQQMTQVINNIAMVSNTIRNLQESPLRSKCRISDIYMKCQNNYKKEPFSINLCVVLKAKKVSHFKRVIEKISRCCGNQFVPAP